MQDKLAAIGFEVWPSKSPEEFPEGRRGPARALDPAHQGGSEQAGVIRRRTNRSGRDPQRDRGQETAKRRLLAL